MLDSPDNLLVTPRGGVLLCEDDASGADNDTHPLAPGVENVNRLVGINRRGEAFEFAVNALNDSEFRRRLLLPRRLRPLRQPLRRRHPRKRHDLRHHGPWHRGAL